MRPAIINGRIVHIGGTETDRLSSIGGQWFFEPQDVFPPYQPGPLETAYFAKVAIDDSFTRAPIDDRYIPVAIDDYTKAET